MVVSPDSNGPSGTGRSRRRLATIVAVVVGVLALVFVLVLVLRGGAEDDNGDTAAEVATRYFELDRAQDCALFDQVTDDFSEYSRAGCEEDSSTVWDYYPSCPLDDLELTEEDTGRGSARYGYVLEGGSGCVESGTVTLVREEGLWKVDEVDVERDDSDGYYE